MKDFGSQVKSVGGNEGDKCNYSVRLDTYGCGCGHDCDYCYAKSLLEFRGAMEPAESVNRRYIYHCAADTQNAP